MLKTLLLCLSSLLMLTACAITPLENKSAMIYSNSQAPKFIETKVGRLAYYDFPASTQSPSAPSVVLWPSVFSDHSIYLALLEQWKGQFRVILIDGPGHGASGPAPVEGFSMKDCAVAIHTLVSSLGVSNISVGGTSWGGLVGGEYALLYPESTHSIIMLNTPIFAEPGIADSLIVLGARLIGNTQFYANQVAKGFFMAETIQAQGQSVSRFYEHFARGDKAAMSFAVKQVLVKREELAKRLRDIKAPVLFVQGKFDDMYPAERLARAAASIPRKTLITLDTKHISVVDQPAEIARLIAGLATNEQP